MKYFMETADLEIYNLINEELVRQRDGLEMIASENYTYPSVMEAMGSILTNKYAEGYPNKRYYGGCEVVDKIEALAIKRATELFGCKYANVQPHAGSQANTSVYAALLKAGDKILGMDLNHGGHLTHGAKVSISGQNYSSFFYGTTSEGTIDYDKVEEIAKIVRPKIIVCGFSSFTGLLDFSRFRAIADSVGAYLLGDVSHIAGLVVSGEYPNPFPHCHVVTTTTHKTLRGPRGGMILSNDEEIASKIDKAIFPGTQGGPLLHVIAAKAIGFSENLKPEFKEYAKAVKANANTLAVELQKRGYKLVGGGTKNHMVVIDLLNAPYSGKEATEALGNAGITVNKNSIPNDNKSPLHTSGVRLGSPALTARGMGTGEFVLIANKIADILDDIKNTKLQEKIRTEILELVKDFPIYDRAIF